MKKTEKNNPVAVTLVINLIESTRTHKNKNIFNLRESSLSSYRYVTCHNYPNFCWILKSYVDEIIKSLLFFFFFPVTLHDIVHTEKSLTLVFEYLERDLKQYMDDCGGILAMNNVKVKSCQGLQRKSVKQIIILQSFHSQTKLYFGFFTRNLRFTTIKD